MRGEYVLVAPTMAAQLRAAHRKRRVSAFQAARK
jgi:hypothetical protein